MTRRTAPIFLQGLEQKLVHYNLHLKTLHPAVNSNFFKLDYTLKKTLVLETFGPIS